MAPFGSCRSPAGHRDAADDAAYGIIEEARENLLGSTEPFTIETPAETLRRRLLIDQALPLSDVSSLGSHDVEPIEQWPDPEYFEGRDEETASPLEAGGTLTLTLLAALEVGAHNSREYQRQKELVFEAALALDLERDRFRQTWSGFLSGGIERDLSGPITTGTSSSGDLGVVKRFGTGALLSVNLAVDLVKLLTQGKDSSFGILGDATIAIPLLRGSSRFVVTEPLEQADRDTVYAIYGFERFKRIFAVQVASEYYTTLQLQQQVEIERENYRLLGEATGRARRLEESQRVDRIQVDQTRQDELKARDSWVQAIRAYEGQLDLFKLTLGLPVDARIELEREELERLAQSTPFATPEDAEEPPEDLTFEVVPPTREGGGPYEIDPDVAVRLALQNRLDLRVSIGRVFDAQRTVAVAADRLRADLTLLGNASLGERRALADVALDNAELRPERGIYSALAILDLPLERTAERNLFRESEIGFEIAVRSTQELEDRIKFEVREDLRILLEARERLRVQVLSVRLAERRVEVTRRLMQVGRAEARDFLEAQTDLTDALSGLSQERVRYRLAELAFQRDLDLLTVDGQGLWREIDPALLVVEESRQ